MANVFQTPQRVSLDAHPSATAYIQRSPSGLQVRPPTYREVIMASAVPVPYHTLEESPNSRTIKIGDWEITARTNPISNAGELDALQIAVGGFPLPEMTFGNNALELVHGPSGWRYGFSTEDALKGVKNGELEPGDGGVKVGHADAWLKSRYVTNYREPGSLTQARTERGHPLSFRCPRLSLLRYMIGHIRRYTEGISCLNRLLPSHGSPRIHRMRITPFLLQNSRGMILSSSTPRYRYMKMNYTIMVHLIYLSGL